jgi:YspA, cpYpsA-related SLOG family
MNGLTHIIKGFTMKVIIAGGRTFNDFGLLCEKCDNILVNQTDIEIVSGTANGADKLGERYASKRGYPCTRFPANWNKFGKSAGYLRNKEMAEYGDALIVFWDGKSKGTKHMIDLAENFELKIRVINY